MPRVWSFIVLALAGLAFSQGPGARADVKPHALFTEGMVLQQGVPVPRRQATPLFGIEYNGCDSWPRPSQTVAQEGSAHPSACRVIFHGGQSVMTADVLRCHAADQSGNHLQCCLVRREQLLNSGECFRFGDVRRQKGRERKETRLQDGECVIFE